MDPGIVEQDVFGVETHKRGDSVWVERETALRLILDGAAWVNYDGEWVSTDCSDGALELIMAFQIDHVKNRGIFEPEKIDGKRIPKEEHILFDKKLEISYSTGFPFKSWIVTKESIKNKIRKTSKIDINQKVTFHR